MQAAFAEWVLCRFTKKDQATSIIGDLVEIAAKKGPLWFWLSVCGVSVTLGWRQVLGFVAAFYVLSWTLFGFQMATNGVHTLHRPPTTMGPTFEVLGAAGALLWSVAVYTAIRYGLRDKSAQLALAAASTLSAATCYWWRPAVLWVGLATVLCGLWFSIKDPERRRALVVLAAILVAGLTCGLFAMFLADRYQKFATPGLLGTRELQERPSIAWAGFLAFVLATWITTSVCALAHRWTIRLPIANAENRECTLE
jgi:hypothetical protein